MFGIFKKKNSPASTDALSPPVDLDKPVENPLLAGVLKLFANAPGAVPNEHFDDALREANYLVPILADAGAPQLDADGQATLEAGQQLNFLTCSNDAGETLIPLFTDWPSIRAWTDAPVSTFVMPARDAFEFASSHDHAGAVVNPGDAALLLNREALAHLLN